MILHKIRKTLYPKIHEKKNNIDESLYAAYPLKEREYICILDLSLKDSYELMNKLGFKYEPIAALKTWKPTGQTEDGSFVRREGGYISPTKYQLHIHLFELDHGIMLAGHYEYSWIRHPHKHYRGVDYDPLEGELRMKNLLDENEIEYYV